MHTARVYDDIQSGEGQRILVDRLWPRGIRKDDPRAGIWIKDVAPSTELRHWYGHDPDKFDQFSTRYRAELDTPSGAAALEELRRAIGKGPSTLVTATKDLGLSHLVVLTEVLEEES